MASIPELKQFLSSTFKGARLGNVSVDECVVAIDELQSRAQDMDELVEVAKKTSDTIARLLGMPKQRLDNPQIQDVLQKRHNDLCATLSKIGGKQ